MEKDEIITLAEKTKRYCDLLIEQSDNWLSEEEGLRNVEKCDKRSFCVLLFSIYKIFTK